MEKVGAAKQVPLQFIITERSFRVDDTQELLSARDREWKEDFLRNRYKALFRLGFEEAGGHESMSFAFLRTLAERFLEALCALPELELAREQAEVRLDEDVLESLLQSVPYSLGAEFINEQWLSGMFRQLNMIFAYEITEYEGSVAMFLAEKNKKLRVPERIFFHLVENDEPAAPFAFLATYATRDNRGRIKHMPLQYALTEYANEREKLVTLLSSLERAAEKVPFIGELMESGEMFHPLMFTAEEAYVLLKAVPQIEEAGILCRLPNWWKKRYSAMQMQVQIGEKKPSLFGFQSLVEMNPSIVVGGRKLSKAEIEDLLKQSEGLRFIKGKWVEVDHARLKDMLRHMERYEGQEITLKEALRMQMGAEPVPDGDVEIDVGPMITNGKWLSDLIRKLHQPSSMRQAAVPKTINATLRPYQHNGYTWLKYMGDLGFGACLADDMGLGKTLQVLTFLESVRKQKKDARILLIVPASLLGNWQKEAERFAPKLPLQILHGIGKKGIESAIEADDTFLSITTYGMAARTEALAGKHWDAVILDEAQAIKNPASKQTRTIKKLNADLRIAMTGTPIENDLGNLWSLFDFLNKGLLGSSNEFQHFVNGLEGNPEGYQKLKAMVSPFILRRLKTDKTIISDLPDKVEQVDYVELSKKQVALYRKEVKQLEEIISGGVKGMERRGIILAYITKFKQICNHPDQYTGQKTYTPDESGKFEVLRELCETIYEKRERVLVFTQYREICDQLADFLRGIFKHDGFVLHGGTHVKTRTKMVEAFNDPDDYIPFMVLSVKAAGTGLNLTAANHVIHFDRWWNPAVENQATDRAFRIGQDRNVFVHKFVSRGTIEEKIDALINSKKELAENVIGSGGEKWITEMKDDELMNLMRLEL